jgi:hypothetical protein
MSKEVGFWLLLLIPSALVGIICSHFIRRRRISILLAFFVPWLGFIVYLLYKEYFGPLKDSNVSMWSIAKLFSGAIAALTGVGSYLLREKIIDMKFRYEGKLARNKSNQEFFEGIQINPIYVIIGYLEEGGYLFDDKNVAVFYDYEIRKAQIFKSLCDYYLTTINEKSDVEIKKGENVTNYVISIKICTVLKPHFTGKGPDFYGYYFNLSESDSINKRPEERYLYSQDKEYNINKISFLIGVIVRNKIKNKPEISLVFGTYDQMIINFLLDFLWIDGIAYGGKLTVEYFIGIPGGTKISLSDDCYLWQLVNDFARKLKMTHIQ